MTGLHFKILFFAALDVVFQYIQGSEERIPCRVKFQELEEKFAKEIGDDGELDEEKEKELAEAGFDPDMDEFVMNLGQKAMTAYSNILQSMTKRRMRK